MTKINNIVLVHGGFVDDAVEVQGSHAIYVSNPNAVAALIEQAASGVK
jgi:hypothetical protein